MPLPAAAICFPSNIEFVALLRQAKDERHRAPVVLLQQHLKFKRLNCLAMRRRNPTETVTTQRVGHSQVASTRVVVG